MWQYKKNGYDLRLQLLEIKYPQTKATDIIYFTLCDN